MDKKYLQKYFEDKTQIKVNLKNGRFYAGIILDIGNDSILFKDRFGIQIPIDLDSISYVLLVNPKEGWEE